MNFRRVLVLLFVASPLMTAQYVEGKGDVPFVPTPDRTIARMLKLAGIKPADVVYDLGCGDGRIPVMAAKLYGVKAVGIDIDPDRIQEANQNARENGVTDKVRFIEADLFKADISEATVVTLFLLPRLNLKLKPKLLADLKPGTRILSYTFDMGDWKPVRKVIFDKRPIYLWVVPARPN